MNIAVILAGGEGSRMGGGSLPKQFFKVAGKTVLEHTVDVFEKNKYIDEIAIVVNELYVAVVEDIILKNDWKKVRKILKGGKERYLSSLAAIKAYSNNDEYNLIFHDSVRPLLNQRIINDIVKALDKYNAVDVVIPANDTIVQVNKDGSFLEKVPDRSVLRRGQTPQGFKLKVIQKAYELALNDKNFTSTDDCGTVVKYLPSEKVYAVKGDESNMKLTYVEDTYLLDKLFQLRTFSINKSVENIDLTNFVFVVFGGSSGIGEALVVLIRSLGGNVYPFSRSHSNIDISNKENVSSALRTVYECEGKIDFIINTAAIMVKEPLNTMKYETIESLIKTNYFGMVNVALESYKYLKQSKGQLLFYTSSSYTRGRAFYSLYSSTKAAVVNFAQAIAQEWEPSGIRINVINPERTKTKMRIQNFGIEPDNSLLTAEEVALTSLQTLLSDITGQVIDVKLDGK